MIVPIKYLFPPALFLVKNGQKKRAAISAI